MCPPRAWCCAVQTLVCLGDCGRTHFSRRGTECGRVDAQRSTRQTPSLRGHDRTLPYPKSPPESQASGPEAPLAPPPRCCFSKRNLLRLCPESGNLKLSPPVRGCKRTESGSALMSGNTDLPLRRLVEFVQVSCAPFLPRLTEVARITIPKMTSDSPKLSRARLKRLDDSAVGREATASDV